MHVNNFDISFVTHDDEVFSINVQEFRDSFRLAEADKSFLSAAKVIDLDNIRFSNKPGLQQFANVL